MSKRILLLLNVVLLSGLICTAQDPGTTPSDGSWDQDKVNEFINSAVQGNLLEVRLGEMAKQQSSSQEVKDFGLMMVNDHLEANQKLKMVAQNMKVMAPETLSMKHREKIDKLSGVSGEEFDAKYMEMMLKVHEKDIKKFEEAQNNVPDGELKTWIDNTLPILRSHLEQAKAIEEQVTAASK